MKTPERIYFDFSKYSTVEPNLSKNEPYIEMIEKIAKRIYELHQKFNPSHNSQECENFNLPPEEDALNWLKEVYPPNSIQPPFPGR